MFMKVKVQAVQTDLKDPGKGPKSPQVTMKGGGMGGRNQNKTHLPLLRVAVQNRRDPQGEND